MMQSTDYTQEARRLQALSSYAILDTPPETDYDDLTRLAAQLCQTPVALITLLDEQRQWIKSAWGLGLTLTHTPRKVAFCQYAIQQPNQLLIVPDTRQDDRFATNPYVLGEPAIVFYAGMPLVDADGQALGTLCVLDYQPRSLTQEQQRALQTLTRQVVSLLELRRSLRKLNHLGDLSQRLTGQLQQSQQTLSAVVEACPAGLALLEPVWEQDRIVEFTCALTNPMLTLLTGVPLERLKGSGVKKMFPAGPGLGLFQRLVTVVASQLPQHYQQAYTLGQRVVWGKFILTPCGQGVLLTLQDISRLKQTQQQLQLQTANLTNLVNEQTSELFHLSTLQRAILEQVGVCILFTDAQGLIQTANPAAALLLGSPPDQLVGSDLGAFLAMAGRDQPSTQPALASPELAPDALARRADAWSGEGLTRPVWGSGTPVWVNRTPLWTETGQLSGYLVMVLDMTPQKQQEQRLQESLEREQALNQLQSKFIQTASHEFRTPLMAISSSVELVQTYLLREPDLKAGPLIGRQLTTILSKVSMLTGLISDTLSITRLEAGGPVLVWESIDLVAFSEELVESMFANRPDGRQVALSIGGPAVAVVVDKKLLSHVLLNLLGNAFKFSRTNPELLLRFGKGGVELTVVDTGIGIPQSDLAHLFEKFYRATNAASVAGTGLGLSICQEYVRLLGGRLSVESQEGAGSRFSVYLPYAPVGSR